ncbi:MAG: hypothetical protein JW883_12440 [Deltaproteobacteria bacterium]|nr:hypothetical protein [Deltaproteobacteria bacterium]
MGISDQFRNLILSEIDFALKKMNTSTSAAEKLYYFSGIQGVIQRTFNIEYDSDLIFSHFILRSTYEVFSNRAKAIQQGADPTIPLGKKHFDKLSSITKELAMRIKKKQDINDTLKKYIVLSYSLTGNGYYLQEKGLLKI